ncbi:hypothetical protein W911_09865 [Hyphomicrobium nitrativorans NL23]|uniref:Uncharacterized protein n=1 Tax=Hyphomicrobium nitrativorans NL23 TaxID=1029756 RepID=V5SH10_9HYPH|nr:hypothetical protein [Hyphomicrobium nitrativorans]AHB50171.1 hypothetical protein W911_09865 [Hyphomicrobium nitrativorans NL23]
MHKPLAAFAVAAALVATSALAAPADQDACNSLAFELADKAAKKKLSEPEALKVDQLIGKLEGQCGEGKLADAGATAKDIEAAIK